MELVGTAQGLAPERPEHVLTDRAPPCGPIFKCCSCTLLMTSPCLSFARPLAFPGFGRNNGAVPLGIEAVQIAVTTSSSVKGHIFCVFTASVLTESAKG